MRFRPRLPKLVRRHRILSNMLGEELEAVVTLRAKTNFTASEFRFGEGTMTSRRGSARSRRRLGALQEHRSHPRQANSVMTRRVALPWCSLRACGQHEHLEHLTPG